MFTFELETFTLAALKNYTPKSQMEMAEEECAEFIVAMCHFHRGRAGANEAVIEEVADVIIMMAQMREHFGSDAVDAVILRKVDRELKRISDPNYSPERKQHGALPPDDVAWQMGRMAATIVAVKDGIIGTTKAELDAFEAALKEPNDNRCR